MSVIKSALDRAFPTKNIRKILEMSEKTTVDEIDEVDEVNEAFTKSGSIENDISIIPFIGCKINRFKSPKSESLSFDFSGCAMAQYKERGVTYAAHICLYGAKNDGDCRKIWNDFINKTYITDVILFYPKTDNLQELQVEICEKRRKFPDVITICGYIKGNECYSAVIDIERNEVIKEIKHAPLIGKENCNIGEEHGETGITPPSSSCVIL